jgi:GT2 family glycosyltransferase
VSGPSESKEPDLSIVIVSWNTRELLLECLRSLEKALAELAPRRVEVLVVDNGSCDGTAAAVVRRHPEFSLLPLEQNVGYARGMNAGLQRARGDVCLMLNSDTRVTAEALARALSVIGSDASIAAVGVQLLHPDGRLQNSIHAFPGVATETLPVVLLELLLPGRYPSKRRRLRAPTDVEAVLGAALFVRREAIERVGLLCEDYFFFLEDTDWCFRARAAGLRVVHVPDARIEHLSGGSSKRRDAALTRIEFHRSLYRFLRLHRGRATLALVAAQRVVKGVGSVLGLSLAAPFSARQRDRLRERASVLGWHLRGCPPTPGVAQIAAPIAGGDGNLA